MVYVCAVRGAVVMLDTAAIPIRIVQYGAHGQLLLAYNYAAVFADARRVGQLASCRRNT